RPRRPRVSVRPAGPARGRRRWSRDHRAQGAVASPPSGDAGLTEATLVNPDAQLRPPAWPRAALALVVLIALSFAASLTTGVSALVNARTGNASNVFATTALYAPSGLTATTAGHDVTLSWTAGQNGSGYSVLGVNNGSSSNCSSVTYSSVGTASGKTYT